MRALCLLIMLLWSLPASAADAPSFRVNYEDSANLMSQKLQKELKASKRLEGLFKTLNEVFRLATPVNVTFKECPETNTAYDGGSRTLTLCYGLIQSTSDALGTTPNVIDASIYFTLEEIGRILLMDVDYPKESIQPDTIHELTTVLLISTNEGMDTAALQKLTGFMRQAGKEQAKLAALTYWQQKPLTEAQANSALCLLYGSDPEKLGFLKAEQSLDEAKAPKCEEQFNMTADSWSHVLSPYLKEAATP